MDAWNGGNMKVTDKITVYAGTDAASAQNSEKENRKAIYAGQLKENTLESRIEQKKKEAQEKALKVVSDAWEVDRSIDKDLQSRRDHIDSMKQENQELLDKIQELEQAQADLPTENEAEYQQRMEEFEKEKEAYQEKLDDNMGLILEENAIIRATSVERLKDHSMVDANKQAESIMEAASDAIIGMVVEDSKEHIDEEQEKRQEEADKIEEKQEEQEEFIEAQKEKKEENEELLEEIVNEEVISLTQNQTDVQAQVQDILNKMKLVAEDIKGAMVDTDI